MFFSFFGFIIAACFVFGLFADWHFIFILFFLGVNLRKLRERSRILLRLRRRGLRLGIKLRIRVELGRGIRGINKRETGPVGLICRWCCSFFSFFYRFEEFNVYSIFVLFVNYDHIFPYERFLWGMVRMERVESLIFGPR